jgi:hypothetical protein
MLKTRFPKLSPMVMAGVMVSILPLLCDLCVPPLHHPVFPLLCGAAWAGEDDFFADTPEQIKADIESCFKKAGQFLDKEDIRGVRKQQSIITLKIDKYKKSLRRKEIKAYKKQFSMLDESVKRKIDSLVNANLSIVEKHGQRAGYAFRQMLANQKGISETDLAPVDQAIVERGTYEKNEDESSYTQPPEVPSSGPAIDSSRTSIQDISGTGSTPTAGQPDKKIGEPPAVEAPFKPAERSEEIDNNRLLALERAAKVRSLIDAGKVEEATIVFNIYQQQIVRYSGPDEYKNLKAGLDAATVRAQQQQAQATKKVKEIERLLDQNRFAEAFVEFNKSRDTLKPHLDKDVFKALDKNVRQSYVGFIKTQFKANERMRDLREMLAQKKTEKANAEFEAHREELKLGLSKDSFENLRKDIAAAYAVILDQKKHSTYLYKRISSLIKKGNGGDAWDLFNGNKLLLQGHLDKERFSTLETKVQKARDNYLARQDKARSVAKTIDSLLDRRAVEEAYALFEDTKKRLKTDLADDTRFRALKDRVSEKYADLRAKQRSALRTSDEIKYLIQLHEGRKAYDLFSREEPMLRKYLAPAAVKDLKDAAAGASAEYSKRSESARKAASDIQALLDQNNIEQAFVRYQKAEADFDFYLDEDTHIKALGKRVQRAYAKHQGRKQLALEQVKAIRRLIEKRRGNEAFVRYTNARIELSKYIDSKTFDALAKETERANREFEEDVSRARQYIDRVLAMLAQNQVEEAYEAFNSVEADLRRFLKPSEYDSIKTRIEASKSAIKGKKKEALAIVKTMDKYIDRKRGDSAYQTLIKNNSFLAAYLNPDTYKKVSDRADAAKTDFEKNSNTARDLEGKLYKQLKRDRVLDAHELFGKKRDYLETYLDKKRFVQLKTAISKSYDTFMKEQKKARAVVSALVRMIRRNKGVEANAEFNRCEKKLSRYLPSDEYLEIVAKVTKGYNSTLQGRTDAKEASDAIRQLLKQDEAGYAYVTFKEMKSTLERYMSSDKFTALETKVADAWAEREKKVKQAREYAKKLRQLVAKKKTTEAYRDFRKNRHVLAKYLDEAAFTELKNTVVDAYKKGRMKKK